jgi:hypothetical protein
MSTINPCDPSIGEKINRISSTYTMSFQTTSNGRLLALLKSELVEPNFRDYTVTSINHILIGASGYDGPESRQLALELLEKFLFWYLDRTDCYVPPTSDCSMYPRNHLYSLLTDLRNYQSEGRDDCLKFLSQCSKRHSSTPSARS